MNRPLQRAAREHAPTHRIRALKPLPNDARAQQVTRVVDAFRRLRGSVVRFIQMFEAGRDTALPDDALSAMSLRELLATLEEAARAARFTRLRDLEQAIAHARVLERTRDDVFSDSFSNDPAAMHEAIAALERADVRFVALCVESVMARHAPAPA
ncbi:hypothetical protein [Burkholderia pseudomultivorans]|uniref:Uncharacterized protein n=1 Tax=Burkholderia pseudomultivorans TaxID=1207504 RepID=A0A132E8B9_9BURK|nr:hypothetical protein [Burkholderia pseudomultivorans]KWF18656.1 hypothetical protein WT56_30205 [Burkholderia pseudomultivorans]